MSSQQYNSLVTYCPPSSAKGYDITKNVHPALVSRVREERQRHKACIERDIRYVPKPISSVPA